MNGHWYPWGYTHTSPVVFVAAWRHIVTLFRAQGARNVTWLWTVNIIDTPGGIPSPGPWWPGSSYVTWVGIDGYYYESVLDIRFLVRANHRRHTRADPRPNTHRRDRRGARPWTSQRRSLTLFAGIHLYGLLGFVWFNVKTDRDWRLSSPSAIGAFRLGAKAYHGPTS